MRYQEKLERLEKEVEFIRGHKMEDEIVERAILYSFQVSVEISMDIAAMKIKDIGLTVEDDYINIEKLEKEKFLSTEEAELLKKFNGLRNAVVHRYDRLDMDMVTKGLADIKRLRDIAAKLSG